MNNYTNKVNNYAVSIQYTVWFEYLCKIYA